MIKSTDKSLLKIFLIAFTFIFTNPHLLSAQEKPGKIGIGVSMQKDIPLVATDTFYAPIYELPNVYFVVNGSDIFSLEAWFGFYRLTEKTDDYSSTFKFLRLGFGFFVKKPVRKMDIYYGGRFGINTAGEDNTLTDILFGPVVGVEYFLSDYFSLGGDIFFRYTHYDSDYSYEDESDHPYQISSVFNFIMRWYFFPHEE